MRDSDIGLILEDGLAERLRVLTSNPVIDILSVRIVSGEVQLGTPMLKDSRSRFTGRPIS